MRGRERAREGKAMAAAAEDGAEDATVRTVCSEWLLARSALNLGGRQTSETIDTSAPARENATLPPLNGSCRGRRCRGGGGGGGGGGCASVWLSAMHLLLQ